MCRYPKDISVRDQEKPEILVGNIIFAPFRSEVSGKPGQPRCVLAPALFSFASF